MKTKMVHVKKSKIVCFAQRVQSLLTAQLARFARSMCKAFAGPRRELRLVHTGCQHPFESKDHKRLVPTGCYHSLWSEEKRGWRAAVAPRLLALILVFEDISCLIFIPFSVLVDGFKISPDLIKIDQNTNPIRTGKNENFPISGATL